jgi:hypothetical protein
MKFGYVSHIVNVPVSGMMRTLLFFNTISRIIDVFGPILRHDRYFFVCFHPSIMSSITLIPKHKIITVARVLFPMQKVYKLLTLIAVTDILNLVPWSNLAKETSFFSS